VLHVHTALNTKFNKNQFPLFELIHEHRLTYCDYKSVHSYANALKIQLLVSGSKFFSLKFTRKVGGGGSEYKNFASKSNQSSEGGKVFASLVSGKKLSHLKCYQHLVQTWKMLLLLTETDVSNYKELEVYLTYTWHAGIMFRGVCALF